MLTVEKIRSCIIKSLLDKATLGENYIDWHTENSGECGVTITYPDEQFDIIIKRK